MPQRVSFEVAHAMLHLPAPHTALVPLEPVGHAYPQLPQLFASVWSEAHPLGHTT
jgi:hypothetical protein